MTSPFYVNTTLLKLYIITPVPYRLVDYVRKLVHMNLWPSLTIQFVIVASLCVMAFWFICVFLLVLPAFPLFSYKNPFS